jgi:hypothetical protein
MSVKALITGGGDGLIAHVRRYLDLKPRLCVDAVIDTRVQQPVPATFGPGGGIEPKMISTYYTKSIGALVAQSYRRVITYKVPYGYYGYLIRYTSYQAEAANSRVIIEKLMGELNIVTNVFSGAAEVNGYIYPQWTGNPELEVTEAIGSAADVNVTISYTNESGVSAREAVYEIPKSSLIGTRFAIPLQGEDLGIQSVQYISTSPTSSSGVVKLYGFTQLGYHEDAGINSYETLYAPGAVAFVAGATLGIEFQGGTVAKVRRFDLLFQLSPELGAV